jgi:hypothetical protein
VIWYLDDVVSDLHSFGDGIVAHFASADRGRVGITHRDGQLVLMRMGKIVSRDEAALRPIYEQAAAYYALTGKGTTEISVEYEP